MHLTLGAYGILFLVALLGIIGQWAGGDLINIWRYLAGFVIAALLLEHLLIRRQHSILKRHCPDKLGLGRKYTIRLEFSNPTTHVYNIRAVQYLPEDCDGASPILEYKIPAGESQAQAFTLSSQSLGEKKWGPVYARIRGIFGLAWWNKTFTHQQSFQTLPDHLHSADHKSGQTQGGESEQQHAGAGGDLLILREYQRGDQLKMIDWKATARTGKHIVRLFTEEQHLDIVIMLDAGRPSRVQAGSLDRLHHFINVSARLAEKAVTNGDNVGLMVFAEQPMMSVVPARGHRALTQVRHALEKTRSSQSDSNPLTAFMQIQKWLKHRSLILLLSDLDISDTGSQLIKAIKLVTPKHLVVVASVVDETVTGIMNQKANIAIDPYNALAAQEVEHLIHNSILHIQRLGSHVLRTPPHTLDAKVLQLYQQLRVRKKI